MPTYPSQRPVKPEETLHRPIQTNLIGTLAIANPNSRGIWTPGANVNPAFTLGQALTWHHNNGNLPLLWALSTDAGGYEFKFGYDSMVPSVAPHAPPGMQIKIGHVALTQNATISGEIIRVGAHWELDNNSGAWGSMGNVDGKTRMMANAALVLSNCDPGQIVAQARRAYSRTGWKRVIQQVFR